MRTHKIKNRKSRLGIKDVIGSVVGLLLVSEKRNEYREKMRNLMDVVFDRVHGYRAERSILDDLTDAVYMLDDELNSILQDAKSNIKRARVKAIARVAEICVMICGERLGMLIKQGGEA